MCKRDMRHEKAKWSGGGVMFVVTCYVLWEEGGSTWYQVVLVLVLVVEQGLSFVGRRKMAGSNKEF